MIPVIVSFPDQTAVKSEEAKCAPRSDKKKTMIKENAANDETGGLRTQSNSFLISMVTDDRSKRERPHVPRCDDATLTATIVALERRRKSKQEVGQRQARLHSVQAPLHHVFFFVCNTPYFISESLAVDCFIRACPQSGHPCNPRASYEIA